MSRINTKSPATKISRRGACFDRDAKHPQDTPKITNFRIFKIAHVRVAKSALPSYQSIDLAESFHMEWF